MTAPATPAAPELRLGSWTNLQAAAAPLRLAVFVHEQSVPEDMEWDADDAVSLHAVVLDGAGAALATGRLLPTLVAGAGADAGMAYVGRMAVARSARGTGLGGRVLDALVAQARGRGDRGVVLHAQCYAQGFYAGRGFVTRGLPFDEAGIAHVEMVLVFGCQTGA
ncbi:MAG: GNAT family N-acetyltransferase [Pseudomonadota bacterium]